MRLLNIHLHNCKVIYPRFYWRDARNFIKDCIKGSSKFLLNRNRALRRYSIIKNCSDSQHQWKCHFPFFNDNEHSFFLLIFTGCRISIGFFFLRTRSKDANCEYFYYVYCYSLLIKTFVKFSERIHCNFSKYLDRIKEKRSFFSPYDMILRKKADFNQFRVWSVYSFFLH